MKKTVLEIGAAMVLAGFGGVVKADDMSRFGGPAYGGAPALKVTDLWCRQTAGRRSYLL